MPESTRRVDPTLNPITRRPGPGRGRPRKLPASGVEGESPGDGESSPAPVLDTAAIPSPGTTQEAPTPDQPQPQLTPQNDKADGIDGTESNSATLPMETLAAPASTTPDATDGVELEEDADAEGTEEHPAKRPRLDTQELEQEQPLDDEAVLALAAHNGATGSDYPEE